MMTTTMIRGTTVLGAAALLMMTAGCEGERAAQARAAERGGVVLAHADTPTPPAAPVSDTAVEVPTRRTDVTYGEAESVFRKGRYAESAELFGIFVEGSPDNAFGHYMLGLSAWKSGDHERAEGALRRAVELNGESVKIRTNLGRVLLERGQPLEALPQLEAAVEIEPTSHEVWRVLGNTYARLRRNDEAVSAYQQALMLNDHDAWSMNNYGLLLIELGRYDEAVRPLARAVELVPLSATFQNNLGVALERIGETEGARQAFAAAVAADSTYEKARTSLQRVEQVLTDITMPAPDLSVFAQEFIDEIQSWMEEGAHDC